MISADELRDKLPGAAVKKELFRETIRQIEKGLIDNFSERKYIHTVHESVSVYDVIKKLQNKGYDVHRNDYILTINW
jgi:hypothetical protein